VLFPGCAIRDEEDDDPVNDGGDQGLGFGGGIFERREGARSLPMAARRSAGLLGVLLGG
jgi:hypothetical protein